MPIDVTELGMEIEVIPVHLSNTFSPIEVTVLGIIVLLHPEISVFVAVSIIALQLSRESYLLLPLSTVIDVKLGQATKNARPISAGFTKLWPRPPKSCFAIIID